jgi:hypothetical protein
MALPAHFPLELAEVVGLERVSARVSVQVEDLEQAMATVVVLEEAPFALVAV